MISERFPKRVGGLLLTLFATALIAVGTAAATTVEHEGFLIGPAGQPLNGTYDLTFTLYEGASSDVAWREKHTSVEVHNGSFKVNLGTITPFDSSGIDWSHIYMLGIRAGSDEEQKPRVLFDPGIPATATATKTTTRTAKATPAAPSSSARPPSISASLPDTQINVSVAAGGVSTGGASGHISNRKNPHKVTAAQIGAATTKDIETHASKPAAHHRKTTSFIELEDKIGSGQIAADTITGYQIRNGSIQSEDLADKAISANKIKAGTGSGLDADLIDGMQANEIIAAAKDEVRTPISTLPFTISKPGSYFLTGDLKVSKKGGAIVVKTDNVTLNLNGFSIIGDGSKVNGISIDGTHNVAIENGTIRGFGAAGIFATTGDGHRISQVRAINNGSGGIFSFSSGTLISECMAWGNSSVGIAAGSNSIIRSSISRNNQGNGISAENGSSVIGNTVYGNKGEYGISAGGSTIRENNVSDNADTGIFSGSSTLIGNTVSGNGGWGIQALDGSTILSNTVSMNNKGNAPEKGGISVGDDCQIKGNTVVSNKRNNIHVSGSDNLIEENLVTDSLGGNGINFAHPSNGPQNFFANNRASGNGTDYAGNPPTGKANSGNVSF